MSSSAIGGEFKWGPGEGEHVQRHHEDEHQHPQGHAAAGEQPVVDHQAGQAVIPANNPKMARLRQEPASVSGQQAGGDGDYGQAEEGGEPPHRDPARLWSGASATTGTRVAKAVAAPATRATRRTCPSAGAGSAAPPAGRRRRRRGSPSPGWSRSPDGPRLHEVAVVRLDTHVLPANGGGHEAGTERGQEQRAVPLVEAQGPSCHGAAATHPSRPAPSGGGENSNQIWLVGRFI